MANVKDVKPTRPKKVSKREIWNSLPMETKAFIQELSKQQISIKAIKNETTNQAWIDESS